MKNVKYSSPAEEAQQYCASWAHYSFFKAYSCWNRTSCSISISKLMETIWAYFSVIHWLLFATEVAQRSLISGKDLIFEINAKDKTSDMQRFCSQTHTEKTPETQPGTFEKRSWRNSTDETLCWHKALCNAVCKAQRTWLPHNRQSG